MYELGGEHLMDSNSHKFLKSNPHLIHFVRQNPEWYRYISRDPSCLREIESEAKVYYGKTLPQRLKKINEQLQMADMLFSLASAMKD